MSVKVLGRAVAHHMWARPKKCVEGGYVVACQRRLVALESLGNLGEDLGGVDLQNISFPFFEERSAGERRWYSTESRRRANREIALCKI